MGAKKTNPDDSSEEAKGKMKVVTDADAKTEKKSLFGAAKTKAPAAKAKTDKESVLVPEMEQKLKDLQEYRAQIADLEALVGGITDELKSVAWDKFIELYKRDGANPNTFLIKDGSGCIMVLPTDKYISIKDEERADKLEKAYGDIVTREEKFYFNSAVLERNMETINSLLMDSPDISDADKENLLQKEVKLSIKKGTIDNLLQYGDKMATVLSDIQPVMQLKNCGGAMAEGGSFEEEIIYDSRDDYFRNEDFRFAGYSNCCDAPIYGQGDICSQCGEHCDIHNDQKRLAGGGKTDRFFDVTEEDIENLKSGNEQVELGHWVLLKTGNQYEATRDGLYMEVFANLEDLLNRENQVDYYGYNEELSEEDGEEVFTNEKGEVRKYKRGGRIQHDHRLNSFQALLKKYNGKK